MQYKHMFDCAGVTEKPLG